MTKSPITREESIQAVFDLKAGYTLGLADIEILKRVARMALAAMDSEPVAVIDPANLDYLRSGADADVWPPEREEMGDVLLYRHAQPALVIPDEMTAEQAYEIGYCYGDPVNVFARGANWMRQHIIDSTLAAAQHDTPALNSVQSVVTVPGKWIPVSERMPESNGVYFGWDGKRVLEVNCFFGGFSANQFIHGEITHWMPLPAAPQEVNHG
ncbi:TPA: DUF551 domain-containing protein [Klebsiella pneumoniae]|nr:DUF551 domain-containing protein [Klebsiella pneumoniae]